MPIADPIEKKNCGVNTFGIRIPNGEEDRRSTWVSSHRGNSSHRQEVPPVWLHCFRQNFSRAIQWAPFAQASRKFKLRPNFAQLPKAPTAIEAQIRISLPMISLIATSPKSPTLPIDLPFSSLCLFSTKLKRGYGFLHGTCYIILLKLPPPFSNF